MKTKRMQNGFVGCFLVIAISMFAGIAYAPAAELPFPFRRFGAEDRFRKSLEEYKEREFFEDMCRAASTFRLMGGYQEINYILGLMYQNGVGVAANPDKAAEHYRYAALPKHGRGNYYDYACRKALEDVTGSGDVDFESLMREIDSEADGDAAVYAERIREFFGKKIPVLEYSVTEKLSGKELYETAQRYFTGLCAPLDGDVGLAYLIAASKKGHAPAVRELANDYANGYRVLVPDEEMAMELLLPLEEKDDAEAMRLLDEIFSSDVGERMGTADYAEAVAYYEKAIEPADESAPRGQRKIIEKGRKGVPANPERVAELAALEEERREKRKADNVTPRENIQNLYEKGLSYYEGNGVDVDYFQAATFLSRSYELCIIVKSTDFPECGFRLGWIQEHGLCGEPNYYGAGMYYRTAAEQGHPEAMFRLAMLHESGNGARRSRSEAEKWYGLAAEAGVDGAEERLAQLRAASGGEPDSDISAVLVEARFLVYMDFMMNGKESELKEHVSWLLDAAENGNPAAQFMAGAKYVEGDSGYGIAKDRDKGVRLLREAAKTGLGDAIVMLRNLGEPLPENVDSK